MVEGQIPLNNRFSFRCMPNRAEVNPGSRREDMQNNASFLAMIEQPCMISRLTDELREALRDFRKDPMAFVTTALKREASGSRRKRLLHFGFAISLLLY